MKISLEWLSDFLDLPGQEEITDVLTRAGLTVENQRALGCDLPRVVAARILESKPHPNADRLSVCQVEDGSGVPRQIVCGAKNYRVGDMVPLALPGAVLPGDFKIKTGKLRGVVSDGMMCSARELGLGEDTAGLLILPEFIVPGTPIGQIFPPDTVLELEVTPNRPDWLSHLGVARELRAFTGRKLRNLLSAPPNFQRNLGVARIEARESCPFYSALILEGVRVTESPAWIKRRLEAVGMRPINNIVDATNYVMLEMGQPMHAFDAARVRGGICVRRGASNETLPALDGRTYGVEGHLIIADESGPLALGGIMGGEASGVTWKTQTVIIESAIFSSAQVRSSARRLGIFTESSYRFERGVDPAGVLVALQRVVEILGESAGTQKLLTVDGDLPLPARPVSLRPERCRAILGADLTQEEISHSLESFGLSRTADGSWQIPSHRLDLSREVDLIEEVARFVGIERIPSRLACWPCSESEADRRWDFEGKLRERLAGAGWHEARSPVLISAQMASGFCDLIRLRNPLGEEQAVLRPSLVPGLLEAVARNLRLGERVIRLFEIGKTFSAALSTGGATPNLPGEQSSQVRIGSEEFQKIALVLTGLQSDPHWQCREPGAMNFFHLKGCVSNFLLPGADWVGETANEGRAFQAGIWSDGRRVGTAWQVGASKARELGTTHPIVVCELELESLRQRIRPPFRMPPDQPATVRDISFVAPISLTCREVIAEVKAQPEPLLESISAIDLYRDPTGERLPPEQKSLALSLTFRASDRTLNHAEVNNLVEAIKRRLAKSLPIVFRE